MRNLTIRLKITLWLIIVMVVIVALTYAVFFFAGEAVARQTARDDLREIVQNNKEEIRLAEDGQVPPHYHTIPIEAGMLVVDNDFLQQLSGVSCGLYSDEGKLLYGVNLIPRETEDLDFLEGELRTVKSDKDTFYVLEQSIEISDGDELWIRGMVDREQDRELMLRMYSIVLMILPVLIALAALGSYFIARRSLSPIDAIAQRVEQIHRESDLKQRINIDTGDNEIRVMVTALNGMLQRLQDSYDRSRRFTSTVSHDLRTPMAVISAQSELAQEQELSEEAREAFALIQRQGNRVNEMLDSLLAYLRLENSAGIYEMREVNLSELTEAVCDSFLIQEGEGRSIEAEIRPEVFVRGNEGLLQRLLENLLSNACKYGVKDGWVRVRLEEDEQVILSVEDNGIGIEEDDLNHIFDWAYRAKTGGEQGGTGYGLFFVKSIVEMHRGTIEVTSERGKGSLFTVRLPGRREE